ncbi:hypothetical protein [Nodosilinea sp. FACHB-141]|uniref:hypothetical protein n=1 Tax=Nodosilinea sp. FACHB-141 TaxID=2692833 RepID=UPI0016851646|nr:hypothetical protein [Nodosilinea sp. FACHB-141]
MKNPASKQVARGGVALQCPYQSAVSQTGLAKQNSVLHVVILSAAPYHQTALAPAGGMLNPSIQKISRLAFL